MKSISLPSALVEKLQALAAAQGTSVDALLEAWVESQSSQTAAVPAPSTLVNTIADNADDLICAIDLDGHPLYMNEASRALFNLSPDGDGSANANLLLQLSMPSFEYITQTVIPAALTHNTWSGTLLLELKNGRQFPVSLMVMSHRDAAGEVAYLSGIARDISEQTRAEEALRSDFLREKELSELKSRFIAMVSHEFRTPLAVILSSAEMLKRYWERIDLEKQHEYLDRIRAHVQHLKDLVSKVLDISNNDSVQVNFKPTMVDIHQYFNEVVTEIGYVVRETNRFAIRIEGDCAQAQIDPALLRLALNNLILNAAKYSPYGAQIDVNLHCTPEMLQIEVVDRGIGIPLDEQKYLFNPFFRATNVGSVGGTGLGLAVVHQAVRAHGGSIEVESEVGEGTTFRIMIPNQVVTG
jgi:PAS domain S-box-containing protein